MVIIGSGFGGLFAAKALRRAPVRVTLIDRTNHHLFQPLLYQVATGILSEGQIAPATRDVFRNYASMMSSWPRSSRSTRTPVRLWPPSSAGRSSLHYDSLIVAGGAVTSYFGHDEYRHVAAGMKTLNDALFLRGQIFGAFELAEAEPDEARRGALLTFVVIGGGPTGVEMAGQLKELSRRALVRNYRRIDPRRPGSSWPRAGTAGGRHGRPPVPHDGARPAPHGCRGAPVVHGDGHGRRERDHRPIRRHHPAHCGGHPDLGRRHAGRRRSASQSPR